MSKKTVKITCFVIAAIMVITFVAGAIGALFM